MNKFKVIDLFAGAGGLSAGFEQTGCFEVVAAVEIDKNARKTYKENHNSLKEQYFFENIKDIKEDQIRDLRKIGVNIVIGGPPCQGFSNANRQRNTLVSTNNQLVKEYISIIEKLKPKAFVMENVNTMDSDKHKFFKTKNEDTYLTEELMVEVRNETIVIGSKTALTETLINFLNNGGWEESFMINGEIFSKLNAFTKQKDILGYISKETNLRYFSKLITKWDTIHSSYWCNEYKEVWLGLGDQLESLIEGNQSIEFIDNLRHILEVQKILMKFKEILDNNVHYQNLSSKNDSIIIDVQTYNVFEYVKKRLKSLGYKINEDDEFILNAVNFGVPQQRKRLFIVGAKEGLIEEGQKVTLPEPVLTDEKNFIKIADAIKDLELITTSTNTDTLPPSYKNNYISQRDNRLFEYFKEGNKGFVYNHVRTETREIALKRFRTLRPGQNFHDLDEKLKSTYTDYSRTQNTVYKRLSYDSVSGTVLNVRKSMWIHPSLDRAVTIREAARLQSFQDRFIFKGTKDAQYQQVGNAVPPLLARFVAESILKALGEKPKMNAVDIINNKLEETVV
ncbi:DNA cytosine methyltransferase [Evansella tamaricis]|uniref:DNA (cytosine-5-)-methyltransferase n=1 Tax=Evansella tamaricis TaxID=2069301 RepID=A0ABS6JLM3_9BACI|nr:DNA cytosine methyltransferase [Evansella tamaricis]MBU9714114.1 DNA cytosine methyltransferase [Evansella tamaricis]